MFLFDTYVAPSAIHGLGVFTREAIPRGRRVWEYTPGIDHAHTAAEFERLPPRAQRFLKRHGFHDTRTGYYVLGGDFDLFSNHSADPRHVNLVADGSDPNPISAALIASRDIPAGEELLADYREWDRYADEKLTRL
ncbi:MAG: SET domain-containing protein [Chloroflexi bacterium]|nr:SET domain-containing protein [Chloroflexota bacterium]